MLELFAAEHALELLEAELKAATGAQRVSALVAVAWQIRQRDTTRSSALASEAELALAGGGLPAGGHALLTARLQLIRGETQWLVGDVAAGVALAERALQGFAALADAPDGVPVGATDARLGCADANLLLAALARDLGDTALRDAKLQASAAAALDVDAVRVTVAQAALAFNAAFRDVAAVKETWGAQFAQLPSPMHPAAACALEDFWGIVAMQSSDYVRAIRHWSKAYALGLASGQIRRAIVTALNIGAAFNNLNDHHDALEWMRRGLALARPCGWPGPMGNALLQTGGTLRMLQRFDAAAEMLREAQVFMAHVSGSRSYAVALLYQAETELAGKHFAPALASFQLLQERAVALGAADLLSDALYGQAKALIELGQPEPALQAAQAALDGAGANTYRRMDALRALADIHARHVIPPPPGMHAASAPLHYLELAMAAAASIQNYTPPGDMLEALAREYARMGDTGKAYALALQANQAREKIHSAEASNRASALQVNYETENARAESEHQRQLAMAHAERANALERANTTLEELGAVGRDITRNLDANAIFTALDRHVHALLDATTFWIYRLEADGQTLKMVFGVEADQPVPSYTLALDDPQSLAARCARTREEVITDIAPGQSSARTGTLATLSLMFAPLLVDDRLLGVMTIQSVQSHAYAEREVAIFRTLCSYGAIALANDERTSELRDKNKELERLSVTDRLTGLFNRLRLDHVLADELHRSQRYTSCFSLVLLDIDHFKSVNDTHGHAVGDAVLVEVARRLGEGTREIDVVGRWGGEEFLVICPDTNFDGAMATAEKLRALIASQAFAVVGTKTSSFGVASFRNGDTVSAIMARADAALYRSKAHGRNRVEGEA
ncbi:MAG: GGDEF domain-containing protein [Pseudomonadota bacterium]